ncbi:hypothetical protein [Bradyrhizobium sp. HKCCYLS20291]|uniref:hypothetical protein n=1 Tax=Bradyrhizobium sp. HKCCYLS20291 TaxID=3420766 RepID=UPI003EB9194B
MEEGYFYGKDWTVSRALKGLTKFVFRRRRRIGPDGNAGATIDGPVKVIFVNLICPAGAPAGAAACGG